MNYGLQYINLNREKVFDKICSDFKNPIRCDSNSLIIEGDSFELLKRVPNNSISLILTDPPYHTTKKRNIIGDTNFSSNNDYIEWMRKYAKEWYRVLLPSGSVFCFCSSAMSAYLQIMFSEFFNVLNEICWTKPNTSGYDGWKQKIKKEALRRWYPQSERIIFLEKSADDNLFKSCFGSQLTKWRKLAGLTTIKLAELIGAYGKVNHGGAVANWEAGRNIPNLEQYNRLRSVLTDAGVNEIPEYEDIIRPFNVNKNVEYTDIWTFESVKQYKGKHPAEKPLDLLEHAIKSITHEGDIVLDCFAGSGSTGIASYNLSRRCILFEIDHKWCKYANDRLDVVSSKKR